MAFRLIPVCLLAVLMSFVGGGGWLGVILDEAFDEAVIAEVIPNSPADRAGLRRGDRITAVGGTKVATAKDFVAAIQKEKVGAVISLRATRRGKSLDLEATLVKRPDGAAVPLDQLQEPPAGRGSKGAPPAGPGAAAPVRSAPLAFGTDYAAAIRRARLSGRPLLVVFGASWCQNCRELDGHLAHHDLRDDLERFERVRLDTDRHGRLADRFGVEEIPHLAIVGRDGDVRGSRTGTPSVEQLAAFLATAHDREPSSAATVEQLRRDVEALRAEVRALNELLREEIRRKER